MESSVSAVGEGVRMCFSAFQSFTPIMTAERSDLCVTNKSTCRCSTTESLNFVAHFE